MTTIRIALLATALALGAAPAQAGNSRAAKAVAAAVADAARPAADSARDTARKPMQMLKFAGVRPGMVVGELLPGGGYFSRIFAKAVGPRGKVFAYLPAAAPPRFAEMFKPVTDNPAYANVTLLLQPDFAPPEPIDLVWISQNYHDLHNRGGSAEATNAAVFKALKPGGRYVIVDHVAAPGAGFQEKLHRIEPAMIRAEVEKAGFVFDGEDTSLRRSDDDHSKPVFELHDQTDQIVYRFRKPR